MADPSNNDDSSSAGKGFWPPPAAPGNGGPSQPGGLNPWTTPWDYSVDGPLIYGPLSNEAILFGPPDFAKVQRYYAAARDAADPDNSFGPGAGQNDWARYLSGASSGVASGGNSESTDVGVNGSNAVSSYSPAPPVYDDYAGIPEWKRGFLRQNNQAQPWIDFNQAMGYLPGVSANEKNAYREIFAAEGGTVPDGPAVAGIMPQTISDLYNAGKLGDWAASARPQDLTPSQQAQVYRAYMDDALKNTGGQGNTSQNDGHEALADINHPGVAAFVGDTLFREGNGTRMIQRSINSVLGSGTVAVDGNFGPYTLGKLNEAIQTPEGRQMFAQSLKEFRDARYKDEDNREGEWLRNQHFHDLAVQ